MTRRRRSVEPGFYGRIDLGNALRPQLIYSQPVWVERGPVAKAAVESGIARRERLPVQGAPPTVATVAAWTSFTLISDASASFKNCVKPSEHNG